MMNLYYRGYVIREDVRSICYTIYDRRPQREELAVAADSREAMEWVDRREAEAALLTRQADFLGFLLPHRMGQPRPPIAAW